MKSYRDVEDLEVYCKLCQLDKECIRMLNGLEKSLEQHLPEKDRRWEIAETDSPYGNETDSPTGYPVPPPPPPEH